MAEAGVDWVSTAFQPPGPPALPPHQQAATRSDFYTPFPPALSSILSSPDQGLDSPYKGSITNCVKSVHDPDMDSVSHNLVLYYWQLICYENLAVYALRQIGTALS